jgi:hypothetical protein
MNRKFIARGAVTLLFAGHVLALSLARPAFAAEQLPTGTDVHPGEESIKLLQKKPYSPHVNQSFPNRVFFGDAHHHTSFSFDSGLIGTTLGPDEAYRFARGEQLVSSSGQPVKLVRPLDFLAVTDHAEYLGLADLLNTADPELLANEYGRKWHGQMQAGPQEAEKAAWEVFNSIGRRDDLLKNEKLKRTVWERMTETADRFNQPGVFTAFVGYEWTSAPGGNNLHRVVLFRDDAARASQVVPFSAFDSPDPEDLWKYLSDYEKSTGGEVLAIPHNGNISNGLMFDETTFTGKELTRAYAEARSRWEPLAEVTQTKGDGETHPFLSPTDEFANFERWDFGNFLAVPKENKMLQHEYARSALRMGLEMDAKLGANPYKFGMIGSTDSHISLATTAEDNFWGKVVEDEPSPHRAAVVHLKNKAGEVLWSGWMTQASGLAAVWARENTRTALFDAMKRKEVYATTGGRMTVRVFGGWDFVPGDVERADFAAQGYLRGVPMGGDLTKSPAGKSPTFVVRAMRDVDGANLDRIQIIKGWLGKDGNTSERIYDVAVSDGRKIGADGRCTTPVGNTVDVPNAAYTNTIGDAMLMGYWMDPEFDASQRAFYYVRVIEIPSPRWTAYDAKRYGIKMDAEVPMTVTDRAYTSPVWYTP